MKPNIAFEGGSVLFFSEDMIIEIINRKRVTRDIISKYYALGIIMDSHVCLNLDWKRINTEILKKYTVSGLQYIKTKAWRQIECQT